MDFRFENADTKGRNLDQVVSLDMVMLALMLLIPTKGCRVSEKNTERI